MEDEFSEDNLVLVQGRIVSFVFGHHSVALTLCVASFTFASTLILKLAKTAVSA